MTQPTYLDGLNPPQREAVETTEGALLVLAGAGTGKTRVLTTRLAHIILQGFARPEEVLAVTFTNKAAREMSTRIEQLINRPTSGMWLGTFHALSARLLRKHAELAGLTRDFVIIDTDDQTRLIKQLMADKHLDETRYPAKQIANMFSAWKDSGWTPNDVPKDKGSNAVGGQGVALYAAYQKRLAALNACDFGDLLLHVLNMFKNNPDLLTRYQQQFKYVLVDEYQDTNAIQYLWLRLLAMGHRNICVVGDDDQSIYAWRGAQVGNILRFEQDFPGAGVVRLEQNYRSTGHILNAAAKLIAHNTARHDKTLWTDGDRGQKVTVASLWDEKEEARAVTEEIQKHFRNGGAYRDCAILMRTAAQTRPFEERFVQNGIPYQVLGGLKFYERKEIRDALAYLRLTVVPTDDLAFERIINVPRRGIGEATFATLRELSQSRSTGLMAAAREAVEQGLFTPKVRGALAGFCEAMNGWTKDRAWPPDQLMERILEESAYIAMLREDKDKEDARTRLDNLKELVRAMGEYDDVGSFLEHVALVTDTEADTAADAVTIMTVHGAKGLEFDTVFIPGFEDGLFPHQRALDEQGEQGLEEERRLAYVAITRGRRRVIISHASSRRLYGSFMPSTASRFLNELPDESVELINTSPAQQAWGPAKPSWTPQKPREPLFAADPSLNQDEADELGVGKRVFHDKFGYGRITRTEGTGAARKVIIAFDKAGEKKLVASLANLRSA